MVDKPMITEILYVLAKYKDQFDVANLDNRIEGMKVAEKFFQTECADLIKKLEQESGYNGKNSA